ncbi:MAG: peptidyl-prolyl cis-trans isomerase [Epsilonproteobacteria bacterium]|nr:peptidyl-prolyl cis-trans isomerase [Campylobacterota bacterium]
MQKTLFALLATLLLSSSLLFSKTLVTVNGHKITDNIIPQGYEELDDTKKANLMEHLIKEELIHTHLLKQSFVNSSEFKEAFKQQKELAKEQYNKATGKTLNDEQIRNIKGSIALIMYQKQQLQATSIKDGEIKDFYNSNQDKFNFPNSIEIANIIVKTKENAQAIINRLKDDTNIDETFMKIAKEHKQNGYMGWFGEGMAPENLFNTAYKTKAKTLIKTPIQTKHGYHIVYLLNKKTAGKLSYNEAKENIGKMLKQQKVLKSLESKVNELYGNAEIVY